MLSRRSFLLGTAATVGASVFPGADPYAEFAHEAKIACETYYQGRRWCVLDSALARGAPYGKTT